MMKAFRTIPVMLDIAKDVEKHSPQAWIVNYTNPTGLITEAVTKYTRVNIAGLCSGGTFPANFASEALNVPKSSVYYDYIGLNHLNFAYNFTVDGRRVDDNEFDKIAEKLTDIGVELVRLLRLVPIGYINYYFNTGRVLKSQLDSPLSRGETIMNLEKDIFEEYSNLDSKPPTLLKRGGGGYSDVAVGFIDAIYNNTDKWMIINVPNNGVLKFLPDDAVIETGCMVNKAGIKPLCIYSRRRGRCRSHPNHHRHGGRNGKVCRSRVEAS
jgi:6-phospho-beta-glucosidase